MDATLSLGRDGEGAIRKILDQGHRLGRGTARRFTQVYLPSTAMAPARGIGGGGGGGIGGGGGGWIRPEWVDAGRKPARPISSVILRGSDAREVLEDARAFLRLVRVILFRLFFSSCPFMPGFFIHNSFFKAFFL